MARRLIKGFVALFISVLAACLIAVPAYAWSWEDSYSGGFELTPEDTSIFDGTELGTTYVNDNSGMLKLMWSMTGFTGTVDSSSCCEVFLAVHGSNGQQRIDLTAAENAALANAQVTLESYIGSSLDTNLDDVAAIHYDPASNYYSKPVYTITSREGMSNGQPADLYYFTFTGKLADLMGVYGELKQCALDAPRSTWVGDDTYHDFWVLTAITDEHSSFAYVSETDGDISSPIGFLAADGSDTIYTRFDATLGFKFIAPVDDGCILDEVSYTANGVTTPLEQTGETSLWSEDWNEYNVYVVPPTNAPVTITVKSHELQHTVNPDGTITFEDDYLPKGSLVTFVLPDGVMFDQAWDKIWSEDGRPAFAVENAASTVTGGYDYYCWADKYSAFDFKIPDGYFLEGATVSPATAGVIVGAEPEGTVYLRLNAPATITLSIAKRAMVTTIDEATGIAITMSNVDMQRAAGPNFVVRSMTAGNVIVKVKDAITESLEDGDTFSPDEVLIFDMNFLANTGDTIHLAPYWWIGNDAYITIPLPDGWNAETTRLYRYYEESEDYYWAWLRPTEEADGIVALKTGVDGCLGRFVLARESTGTHAPGWSYEADGTYYYNDLGQRMTDYWHTEGSDYYYFAKNGKLVTNDWVQAGGKWYYMDNEGKLVWTGVSYYQGKYYWVNKGNVQTSKGGWKSYKGAYYYFNGAYGAAYAKQWLKYGNAYYYFGADGKLVINGWATYGSYYFYMGANGQPVVNTWIDYGGSRYHFNASGICDQVASY